MLLMFVDEIFQRPDGSTIANVAKNRKKNAADSSPKLKMDDAHDCDNQGGGGTDASSGTTNEQPDRDAMVEEKFGKYFGCSAICEKKICI